MDTHTRPLSPDPNTRESSVPMETSLPEESSGSESRKRPHREGEHQYQHQYQYQHGHQYQLEEQAASASAASVPTSEHPSKRVRSQAWPRPNSYALRCELKDVFKQPTYSMRHFLDADTHSYKCCLFRSDKSGAVGKIIFSVGGRSAGHIQVVNVHESLRGLGMGKVLFQEAFNVLRAYSIQTVVLEAEEDESRYNKLVNWYETLGFRLKPNTKPVRMHNNDRQTFRKVPMICDLQAVNLISMMLESQKHFLPLHLSTRNGMELASDEKGCLRLIEHAGREAQKAREWLCFQSSVGAIALESGFGRFLCAEPSGGLVANRPWQDCWELFELEMVKDEELSPKDYDASEAPFTDICESQSSSMLTASSVAVKGPESFCKSDDDDDSSDPPTSGETELCTVRTFHGLYLGCNDRGDLCVTPTPCAWRASGDGVDRALRCLPIKSPGGFQTLKHRVPGDFEDGCCCKGCQLLQGNGTHSLVLGRKLLSEATQSHCEQLRSQAIRFQLGRWSVKEVIERLCDHKDPLDPDLPVSYGEMALHFAEHVRCNGHPDWMQLTALILGLGRIAYFPSTSSCPVTPNPSYPKDRSEDPGAVYNQWALGGLSWVVGYPRRSRDSSFGHTDVEPERVNVPVPPSVLAHLKITPDTSEWEDLSDDHRAPPAQTLVSAPALGVGVGLGLGLGDESSDGLGLKHASMSWGPYEYMYNWMTHNGCSVPREAFAMVRYHALHSWYHHNEYADLHITSEEDNENRHWVDQLCKLRWEAREAVLSAYTPAHTHAQKCEKWADVAQRGRATLQELWPYYQHIVDKYLPTNPEAQGQGLQEW